MKTTTLSNAHFPADADVARPHSKIGGPLRPIDFVELDNAAPAGSINSSVAEMSRWLMLQLNRGKFPDRDAKLFSEQRSREMWSAETILPIRERTGALAKLAPKFAAYGLGWGLRDYQGRKLVVSLEHTPTAVGELEHWQYDTFKTHWRDRTVEDAFVTFSLNANGEIDHFTMVAVSPLADFSFDYQDLLFRLVASAGEKR